MRGYRWLVLLLVAVASVARADTEISSLPYVCTTEGERYYLTGNLTYTGSGDAVTITANSVTLDGQGNTISAETGAGSSSGYEMVRVQGSGVIVEDLNSDINASSRRNLVIVGQSSVIRSSSWRYTHTSAAAEVAVVVAADSAYFEGVEVTNYSNTAVEIFAGSEGTGIYSCTFAFYGSAFEVLEISVTGTEVVTLRNTVLDASGGNSSTRCIRVGDTGWTYLTHTTNLYWTAGGQVAYYGGSFYAGSSAGASSFEASSVWGTPAFTDSSQATFSGALLAASNARDVGDSTYVTLATDLAGNDRVQGGDTCQVDIGAYEYQAGDCGGAGCTLPTANFGGAPLTGNETLTVSFTDSSTATPTSWKWYFGDGDSSTVQNPSHDYTAGGTYSPQLIATNACGSDTLTRTNYITVNNTGACCAVNYTCTVTDSVTCVTAGSEWQGNDVACSPDPCAETVGSCCLPNNVCIVQVEIGCLGTWTSGATCDPGDCGFRGTCDYTITGADLPYNATAAGTYCLDLSDSAGVFHAVGDAYPEFQSTVTSGRVTLVPFNGWFQDTLRVSGYYQRGLIRAYPPSALTVKGFVIDGTYWNGALIRSKSDGLVVDSCDVFGGILVESTSDSTDGSNTVDGPDNVQLSNLTFVGPPGEEVSGFISMAGRVSGNLVKDFGDSLTISNIYMNLTAPTTDGDGYLFNLTAFRHSTIDDVTIHVGGLSTIGDITPFQLKSIQSSTISNINIYGGIGCDKAMSIRTGTSTETKRPRNLTIRDIFSHMETGAGVNIDADSSRVYNVTSYAPGDPLEAGYVFRLSEQAFNDTIENCLFVSTSDDASAIQIEGSPIYTAGNHRIANVTAVAHGTESGNYGKGAVLYIKADAGELDSLWWNNSAMIQTSPNAPIINTEGAEPTYWALEENAFEGGDNFMENDNGTVIYSTLSAFETAYTEASDNIYVTPGAEPILGNATTQDTTGSYGLHYLSSALDIGDSTLPVLGRTTDLAGNDRVVGANMDPGAYEWFLPGTTGACCFADGTCSDLIEEDCTPLGGTFQGNGTDCDPNPCDQPTGACCVADTVCTVETEADCTTLTGTWTVGTTCDDIFCEAYGACCLANGSCVVVYTSVCALQNGATFLGDGTDCDPDPCPGDTTATGACCTAYGCYVITASECTVDSLGTYIGDDVQCTPDPCTGTIGACCFFWTGTCQVLEEAECTTQGGDYQGDGTDCAPNPCPAAQGACCASDGSCTVTTNAGCTGEWQWATPCEPDPCPDPVGACCLLDVEPPSVCVLTTEAICDGYVAVYQGDGTDCDPDPCGGYLLLVGRTRDVDASSTTTIRQNAPTGNFSADSITYVASQATDVRTSLWKFDLAGRIPGTIVGAHLEATIDVVGTGGSAPGSVTIYRVRTDADPEGATWRTYDGDGEWGTYGALSFGTDRFTPVLGYYPAIPGTWTDGARVRVITGPRAANLVRNFLVPAGQVTIGLYPEAGTISFKGASSSDPPTLTIVYTLDGRRRTLQILGQ